MRICRIGFEVIGERSEEQLVEDTTLVHVKIVCDFIVAPGGERSGVVISCIESIATGQADSVRQDDTRNSICRLHYNISKRLF